MNLNGKKIEVNIKQTVIPSNENSNSLEEIPQNNLKIQIAINNDEYKTIAQNEKNIWQIENSFPRIEKIKSEDNKEYILMIINTIGGNYEGKDIKILNENGECIGELEARIRN